MNFDVRYRDYTFKHTYAEKPDLSAARYQEHFHTTYELLYFIEGDADFVLQHEVYKIRPGSLLIAKPGQYHNIVFHSVCPYERYVIRFSPQAIYPYVRKRLEQAETVYYIAGSPLDEEFHRMDQHLQHLHDDVRLSACIGSMHLIIAHLISSQNLIQKADYVNESAKQIAEYIDLHLPDIHTADELARALHMSKQTVYKTFSQQFNTSLMSYIRTQKCMRARSLLSEGIPATEVSALLGFSQYSSFYRNYQQIFNEAPSGNTRKGTVSQ